MNKPTLFLAAIATPLLAATVAAQPEWTLDWQDEFDGEGINADLWDVQRRRNSFNNEKQFYLPEQVTQNDGNLRITATNEPFEGKAYRSGLVWSDRQIGLGRVEVRAKIPSTKGIWPAIWLLPTNVDWPTGGEIDIMEHRGSIPNEVSSAYHWGNNPGGPSNYVDHRYDIGVDWPDDYHTFAVEREATEIRYYVDGVEHFRVTDQMAPISTTPMNLILNTAVGGIFDGEPDGSTVWPQHFDIDYVRVYKPREAVGEGLLRNGDFELGEQDWTSTGNAYVEGHNLGQTPVFTAVEGQGGEALKLFGFSNTSASQGGIEAAPGDAYFLDARIRVNADDSIAGTQNTLDMSLTFLNDAGQVVGSETLTVADGQSLQDSWLSPELAMLAPAGATTATVKFQFVQPNGEGGAVWVDQVDLRHRLAGDADGDGTVNLADFGILRANFGQAGQSFDTGDFNLDGTVDLADFGILRSKFGQSSDAAVAMDAWAATIPEPAAALSIAASAGVLLKRRR